MLSAGIPIMEAVNSLIEDSKNHPRFLLESLRDDLMQGKRISTTLANFPKVFDKVTTNVVKAAEEAGALEQALTDIKNNIQKEMEFADKIKSAMVYPAIIFTVLVGVLIIVLVVVVPKISLIFSQLKVPLPLPTQILLFMSDLLLKKTPFAIGGSALVILLGIYIFKKNRKLVLGLIFSLPVISQLVKEIDLIRFSRNLYLLLSSGLSITSALDLTEEVVIQKKMTRVIRESKEMIRSGMKLSEGMDKYKGFIPSIIIKLIEVGEKTGSLDKSMLDVSEYLDYKVTGSLKNLTTIMEPIMLVGVGLIVGGIMIAVITPIYGLIGQVSR